MSIEITVSVVCDGCKAVYREATITGASQLRREIISAQVDMKREKWVAIDRGRFYTMTHYCPRCCDKPMKPVPRKKREAAQ